MVGVATLSALVLWAAAGGLAAPGWLRERTLDCRFWIFLTVVAVVDGLIEVARTRCWPR
jgi:hypothetical protein